MVTILNLSVDYACQNAKTLNGFLRRTFIFKFKERQSEVNSPTFHIVKATRGFRCIAEKTRPQFSLLHWNILRSNMMRGTINSPQTKMHYQGTAIYSTTINGLFINYAPHIVNILKLCMASGNYAFSSTDQGGLSNMTFHA